MPCHTKTFAVSNANTGSANASEADDGDTTKCLKGQVSGSDAPYETSETSFC